MHSIILIALLLWSSHTLADQGTNAFDTGYKAGHAQGVDQGRRPGYGMPTEVGMRVMSENHCADLGYKGSADCKKGFERGYEDGFRTKKPFTRKAENYEALSWSNAIPGAKLFNYNEQLEATVTAADKTAGTIQVRYQKGGVVETKRLAAVASVWYIRKSTAKK